MLVVPISPSSCCIITLAIRDLSPCGFRISLVIVLLTIYKPSYEVKPWLQRIVSLVCHIVASFFIHSILSILSVKCQNKIYKICSSGGKGKVLQLTSHFNRQRNARGQTLYKSFKMRNTSRLNQYIEPMH